MPERLLIRTDGASRSNPGPASAGAVLIDAARPDADHPDAPPTSVVARPLGVQTNNVAEYTALVLALEEAQRLGARAVDLRLDSKLIVEQLHGRWNVKDPKMRVLWAQVREQLAAFDQWDATHEPRATNRAADALANLALDAPAEAARLEARYRERG
jgi:probable phosphoglycerate mutase